MTTFLFLMGFGNGWFMLWLDCFVLSAIKVTEPILGGQGARQPILISKNLLERNILFYLQLVLCAPCAVHPDCASISSKVVALSLISGMGEKPWKCKQIFPNYIIIDEVFYLFEVMCRIHRGTECLDMTSFHFCDFIWWAGVRSWCSRVCAVDHHFGSFSSKLPTPVRRTITLSAIWPPYTRQFGGIIYTK